MGKICAAYAKQKGVSEESIKFMFDGERINKGHSVAEAGMADGDQMDCVIAQVGGAGSELGVDRGLL